MIFFIAVMVWIGSIFFSSDPRTRIDRACVPVTFGDSLMVAVVQVIHEPYAMAVHEMMLSVEYGCKFAVWKTFYEEREGRGQVEQPQNTASPKVSPQTTPLGEQQKNVSVTRAPIKEEKEPLTEVHITSKPLPNYLDDK